MDPRLPIDVPFVNTSKLAVPSAHLRRSRSPGDDDSSRVSLCKMLDDKKENVMDLFLFSYQTLIHKMPGLYSCFQV